MNFAMYLLGTLLLIAALAYGAHLIGISPTWIAVGALAVLGIGIMAGVSNTRRPDPPDAP